MMDLSLGIVSSFIGTKVLIIDITNGKKFETSHVTFMFWRYDNPLIRFAALLKTTTSFKVGNTSVPLSAQVILLW